MDKAQKSKVEKKSIDTILQEGIDFYVTVNNPNILHKIGLLKKKHYFVLKPLVLGTLLRISKIMVDIKFKEQIDKENWQEQGIAAMAEHINALVEIIALAIRNDESKASRKVIKILKKNATVTEMLAITSYVLGQMNVSDFMKSIISVKGMSLIKPEETIASGA